MWGKGFQQEETKRSEAGQKCDELEIWLVCPLADFLWEKQCYSLNDKTAEFEKLIRGYEILGIPGWGYGGASFEIQHPLKISIFFKLGFWRCRISNYELARDFYFSNGILLCVTAFDFPMTCSLRYSFCLEAVVILKQFRFFLRYVLYI